MTGAAVGHAAQRSLVLRHGGAACEHQHTGAAVVAARDAVGVGEVQHVTRGETAANAGRGAHEVGVVHIGDSQSAVDHHTCAQLGV